MCYHFIRCSLWQVVSSARQPSIWDQEAVRVAMPRAIEHLRDMQQRLGGIAAVIETGPANFIALNLGDTRASLHSCMRRRATRRPRADHQEIIGRWSHSILLASIPLTFSITTRRERVALHR